MRQKSFKIDLWEMVKNFPADFDIYGVSRRDKPDYGKISGRRETEQSGILYGSWNRKNVKSSMLSCSVESVCKVVQISILVDHDSLLISYLHLYQSKKVFFLYNNKFSGTKRFSTMAARMLQRDRHFKKGNLDQGTARPL